MTGCWARSGRHGRVIGPEQAESFGSGRGRRALGVRRIARLRRPWLRRATAAHPCAACARPPGTASSGGVAAMASISARTGNWIFVERGKPRSTRAIKSERPQARTEIETRNEATASTPWLPLPLLRFLPFPPSGRRTVYFAPKAGRSRRGPSDGGQARQSSREEPAALAAGITSPADPGPTPTRDSACRCRTPTPPPARGPASRAARRRR